MEPRRDVGVVLSGGGVNGVLMELGFLQRLRESLLWPRVGAIFGASAGALTGSLAALDRLDELEAFMMKLQPEQTFRLNRLWRLPFLGLYDYALPKTIDDWFGSMSNLTADLTSAPIELVVVATDLTDDDDEPAESGFELVYSSWTTPYDVFAQAVLASAAVSALVLPLRVGDRIATDGAWVRNYPARARLRPRIGRADRRVSLLRRVTRGSAWPRSSRTASGCCASARSRRSARSWRRSTRPRRVPRAASPRTSPT